MNETMVCAVGNVATQPVYRETVSGASARFRLAVTSRYWDREKSAWTDGHTNFFTVWTGRALATNVGASLSVGDPVIVQGRLKVRTEVRDGQSRTSADIDAVAVGHDLSRGTSAFRRPAREGETGTRAAPAATAGPEPAWETAAGAAPGAGAAPDSEPDTVPGPEPDAGRAAEAGARSAATARSAGRSQRRRAPAGVT
ncbi:single-stranded DNA-binding protein [Streptomyces sp. NPDC008313]|uniref:single-stranded DNA-binding protein n=1 Tax=Streptomyces sp. NPDC008313 TaxID=3364826 RepID=UPI0036E4E9D5